MMREVHKPDPQVSPADGDARSLRRCTAASAGVHALILVALVVVPVSRPHKPIFAEPVYEVAMFQGTPNYVPPKPVRVEPDPKRPEVEKTQEAPKPKDTVPAPPETITPKPGKKPDPPVEKKPEAKPKEPQVKPQPEKERKPAAQRPQEEETPKPPPEKVPEIKSAPVDEVSMGMVDEKDFKQSYYLQSIRAKLSREWNKDTPTSTVPMETVIHFVILRDGTITSPEIVKSSGSGIHDRAAMAALMRVGKFPPLPEEYAGDRLSPTAGFHSSVR